MANFKAGDLALIVGTRIRSEYVGAVVTLHERVTPGELFTGPGENDIRHSVADGPSWICTGSQFNFNKGESYGGNGWAHIAERHLMPLRGDEQPAQQRNQEQPA